MTHPSHLDCALRVIRNLPVYNDFDNTWIEAVILNGSPATRKIVEVSHLNLFEQIIRIHVLRVPVYVAHNRIIISLPTHIRHRKTYIMHIVTSDL